MKIPAIPASEITPPDIYHARRDFLRNAGMGLLAMGMTAPSCPGAAEKSLPRIPGVIRSPYRTSSDEPVTSYADITGYNNFYEFGTGKSDPARESASLRTSPWNIAIEGEVKRPKTIGIEDLLKLAPPEERIYRMRCVEGWSMVIPWVGLPLSALVRWAEPTGNARYVEFETLYAPMMMPGQRIPVLEWPYREGLRMDEAMHPLTLLAVGLYGAWLPSQNGAPLRLVVPWKYGFKSIKSIVRLRFREDMPVTSWMRANPKEYGFYANVNPGVDHPRWTQSSERRIGDGLFSPRRKTLMFNGYVEQVGHMYAGMDLRKYF